MMSQESHINRESLLRVWLRLTSELASYPTIYFIAKVIGLIKGAAIWKWLEVKVWRILTHTVVCRAAKKVARNTRVLFTRTKISSISTCRILKTTEQISTKFTYCMLYIRLILHTEFDIDCASSSRDICSWKLSDFLHIFLLRTKIKIFLKFVKTIFSCFDFFQIWNKNNTSIGLYLHEI